MLNKIHATCDFIEKKWKVINEIHRPGGANLAINLILDHNHQYKNVHYGFELYSDSNLISNENYPKVPMLPELITSKFVVEPSFDVEKNKKYKLNLWADVDGEKLETEIMIENVIDPQPYPSWTLLNGEWVPPKPRPTTKGIWSWDEAVQEWKSLDFQYMPGSAGTATEGLV